MVVVIISSLALMFVPGSPDSEDIDLETGDYLSYTVTTTHQGNTTIGFSNFAMEIGYSSSMFAPGVNLYQVYGDISDYYDCNPIFDNSTEYIGSLVEKHPISTDFGEKNVLTYVNLNNVLVNSSYYKWFLVITDVGTNSNLIYRWTLSNDETTIVIALNETNIKNVWQIDQRLDYVVNLDSFHQIGTTHSYRLGPGGWYSGCDLVEILDGDYVAYNATGMDASVHFISIDQIAYISQTALFHCNETMSSTHVTEKMVQGIPGHYVVLSKGISTSNDSIMYTNWGV